MNTRTPIRREKPILRTFDRSHVHNLALVAEVGTFGIVNSYYVPLADAPAETGDRAKVYVRQMHYVATHVAVGLVVHDRTDTPRYNPDEWEKGA